MIVSILKSRVVGNIGMLRTIFAIFVRTLPWVVRCGQTRENCLPRMAKTPTEQTGYFEPLD